MKYFRLRIELAYLDYFNNYLTVDKFASDYGMNLPQAKRIINTGRKLNNKRHWAK